MMDKQSPAEIDPRPCQRCGSTIDQHRRVDTPEGPEFFCEDHDLAWSPNTEDGPRANGHDAEQEQKPLIIEPLETINPADWDGQKPPARRWIIRNMIPLGEAGLLDGHGGAGKTLLGCQIAVGVSMHTGDQIRCA